MREVQDVGKGEFDARIAGDQKRAGCDSKSEARILWEIEARKFARDP
jgi:hypothetical protein